MIESFQDFSELLIKECEVFGRVWTLEEWLRYVDGLSFDEREEVIKKVLDEYGSSSVQFYFVVQMLVISVLNRVRYQQEDSFSEVLMYVLDKVRYFNEDKGKLISFIYSLVMYKVVQRKYHDGKVGTRIFYVGDVVDRFEVEVRDGEDVDWLRVEVECVDSVDGVEDEVVERLLVERVLGMVRSEVREVVLRGVDSIYRRVYVWEKFSLEREGGW